MPNRRGNAAQGTTGSGSSVACTAFATNPQNGDSIYVWMSTFITGGVTHQAPTDTFSNTYTQIGTTQAGASGNFHLSLWLATNITGGSSFVVTGHVSLIGTTITVIATCLDTNVAYNGDTAAATATSTNPASGTTSPAPSVASYFTAATSKGATAIPTAGSGWQFFTNSTQTDNVSFQDLYVEESITNSSSAMNGQFTCASENWVARAASFAPAVTLALEQEGFRWRNDDGSETTATWKAAQDTNVTVVPDQTTRLRMIVNTTGDAPSTRYKLQYRKVGAASWRDFDTFQ